MAAFTTVLALFVGAATLVGSVVLKRKSTEPPYPAWWEEDISFYGLGVPQFYLFGAGVLRMRYCSTHRFHNSVAICNPYHLYSNWAAWIAP